MNVNSVRPSFGGFVNFVCKYKDGTERFVCVNTNDIRKTDSPYDSFSNETFIHTSKDCYKVNSHYSNIVKAITAADKDDRTHILDDVEQCC